MRHNANRFGIGVTEVIYFLLGATLLLLIGIVANGQVGTAGPKTLKTTAQAQPLYREYRGVRLGMTATDVRAKLGQPVLKSDEQDFYVMSPNETAQIAYSTTHQVVMISTDFAGGVGAPDYRAVVGEGLLERPDGSLFRMVMYNSEGFWVSYNKSASMVPVITITIGAVR